MGECTRSRREVNRNGATQRSVKLSIKSKLGFAAEVVIIFTIRVAGVLFEHTWQRTEKPVASARTFRFTPRDARTVLGAHKALKKLKPTRSFRRHFYRKWWWVFIQDSVAILAGVINSEKFLTIMQPDDSRSKVQPQFRKQSHEQCLHTVTLRFAQTRGSVGAHKNRRRHAREIKRKLERRIYEIKANNDDDLGAAQRRDESASHVTHTGGAWKAKYRWKKNNLCTRTHRIIWFAGGDGTDS